MGTLLCIGFYPYDVAPLMKAARAIEFAVGLEPVLISAAPPDDAALVRAQAAASGVATLDRSILAEEDSSVRNPVRRARQHRRDTRRVIDALLGEVDPVAVLASVNAGFGIFLDHVAQRGIPTVFLQMVHWGDRAFYREMWASERAAYDAMRGKRGRLRRKAKDRIKAFYGFGPYVVWDVRDATLAVQGPALERRLVAEGVPIDHIAVTGNPVLDDLYAVKQSPVQACKRVRDHLGIAEGVPIVTQMRSYEDRFLALDRTHRERAQSEIMTAVHRAAPEARLVVKLHPREADVERSVLCSMDPTAIVVGEDVRTDELLAASDVVVSTASTTLLHSVLLDRPTVSVWLWPGLDYLRRVTDWPAVDRVDDLGAFTESIRLHLSDAEYQEAWRYRRSAFVEEEFLFDGLGTERVVALLARLTALPHRSSAARRP